MNSEKIRTITEQSWILLPFSEMLSVLWEYSSWIEILKCLWLTDWNMNNDSQYAENERPEALAKDEI